MIYVLHRLFDKCNYFTYSKISNIHELIVISHSKRISMASLVRIPLQEQSPNIQQTPEKFTLKSVKSSKPVAPAKVEVIQHDVLYFRNLLSQERVRLLKLCDLWEINQSSVYDVENVEAILGDIRTVVGQAHLIMDERFTQFEGLVNDCEFKTSNKPVTCQDLQGFWEMIYFQVEDVDRKFVELEKRKNSGWKHDDVTDDVIVKKKKKKKLVAKPPTTNVCTQARRDEARKRLAAAKAALREQSQSSVTFDAGFFKVNSPVRTVIERTRTPCSKERKRTVSTPSSDNFLHGRYIRKMVDITTPKLKKSLSFENMEEESGDSNTKTKENGKQVKVVPSHEDGYSPNLKFSRAPFEMKNASTETESCDNEIMMKSLGVIEQQIKIINKTQEKLQDNNSHKLQERIRILEQENQSLNEKIVKSNTQCEERTDDQISDSNNPYALHYTRLVEKVKLLEAELSSYAALKEKMIKSKEKWRKTFDMIAEKTKDLHEYNAQLQKWNDDLKLKEIEENEELIRVKKINSDQNEEIKNLKVKTADFEKISQKLKTLVECNNAQAEEILQLKEESEIIKNERNNLRMKLSDQSTEIENLKSDLENIVETKSFEEEEKLMRAEESNLLQDQLTTTEIALKSTKEILGKVQEKSKEFQKEIKILKENLEALKNENKSLQDANDITKANCRLAIVEQQQDVISSEARLRDLLISMTKFLSKLKKIDTGKQSNETLPDLREHPMKTPSKSLVVSALLRDTNEGETPDWSPDFKSDGRAEALLFTLIDDVTAVMGCINKTAMEVAAHQEKVKKQLSSDKSSLMAKADELKQELANHEASVKEGEMSLRRRLNNVIQQRDERTAELDSCKALLLRLSHKEST